MLIEQDALFFNSIATAASIVFASLLKAVFLFLKGMLGKLLRLQAGVAVASESLIALQQSGSGHLPTPSASTGWHSVGVINSLSLQSGTPSPSVSLLTP